MLMGDVLLYIEQKHRAQNFVSLLLVLLTPVPDFIYSLSSG
jgi:hypothetical protein